MIANWFGDTIKPAITPAVWIWLAILFAALSAGATWWLMRPGPAPEQPAPEQRQADGSLILQRQATTPTARPKQRIPPAAKLERVAQVIVQPDAPAAGQPCPPVTVDLTLIREQDGGRRILASSPDGVVVGGIDVPVEPIVMPAPAKRWAAGLSWSPIDRTSGIWIERDLWRARVGVDLNQAAGVHTSAAGVDARVRIGITF